MTAVLASSEGRGANSTVRFLWQGSDLEVASGEWIVQLTDFALEGIDSIFDTAALFTRNEVGLQPVKGLGRVGEILVRTTSPETENVAAWLANNPLIAFFEPNAVVSATVMPSATVTPNDPYYTQLWGLHNTGQIHTPGQLGGAVDADIDAPQAWDITTGSADVIVASLDTGVDYSHPELAAHLWINAPELDGVPGVDDDGNGMIDDFRGWDLHNGDNDPFDDNYHGTHVAGTIAATGNNGIGVAGVSWATTILPVKVWDENGRGLTAATVAGVNYVSMMRRDHDVDVRAINLSGGNYPFKEPYEETSSLRLAIKEARDAGILFVAAACNNGIDNDIFPAYPGSYTLDNIVSVAATDHEDVLAPFSSFGLISVDLAAPGVDVLSTFPTYVTPAIEARGYSTEYQRLSGTSMAASHVTGTAALLWALNQNASYVQVKDAIEGNVDEVAGLSGKVASGGRLNAHAALLSLQSSADFDEDGDVDGFDLLAWHRGYGIPAPDAIKTDGDADGDQDVDAEDLSLWEGQFGMGLGPIVATAPRTLKPVFVSSPDTATTVLAGDPLSVELVDVAIARDFALRPGADSRLAAPTGPRDGDSDTIPRGAGRNDSPVLGSPLETAKDLRRDRIYQVSDDSSHLDADAVDEALLDQRFVEAGMLDAAM